MATHASFMPGVKVQNRVWTWLTTVDHKRIGILYGTTSFVFFLLAGLESLLMRVQLARPDSTLIGPQAYNELFTMHGTTMIFLAVMPLSTAFINFAVPLLIGARDVAFPRLNALSYWLFLAGGLLLNFGWLLGTAPDAGWFGYANLTSRQFSPGPHLDFWILAIQMLGVSSILGALNFVVTIINMRAPGMRLLWMPVFVWMVLVTQFLVLLAFPPLTVGMIFLMFDRFFGTLFFSPAAGGDPLLWQHLFWIFAHPEVYILILPPMGIISEVIPTFAAKPLFGAPMMIYAGIAIGFLSFGVWSHHMFAVGLGPAAAANAVLLSGLAELFYHWNVRTPYWLGFIFQRPESHCVHHQEGVHSYNFADLPLWDMLFGTFRNPRQWQARCGFGPEREHRLFDMLAGVDVNRPGPARSVA